MDPRREETISGGQVTIWTLLGANIIISEFFSTRTATQCRSHGQKSDHKLIASDNKITQTTFYDPRCFEIIVPETSYNDDVDKFFDFEEKTIDETPNILAESYEAKKIELEWPTQNDFKFELSDNESIGCFLVDLEDMSGLALAS